jgi:hypothetical protein
MMGFLFLVLALAFTVAITLVADRRQHRRLPQAEHRGMALLLENLSARQWEQYQAFGYFDVTGSDTGRRYRIFHGRSRNVRELGPNGRLGTGKCFLPQGDLVTGDCMLAQKIALENCESEALRVALPF